MSSPAQAVPDSLVSGDELAHAYCQQCHAFTEPDALDKQTWKEVILPRMAPAGIYKEAERPDSLPQGVGGGLLQGTESSSKEPVLSREDWEKVVEYFLTEAPDKLSPPPDRPDVTTALPNFRVEGFRFDSRRTSRENDPPRTTMVEIEEGRYIFVGKAGNEASMDLLSSNYTHLFNMALPGVPSSLQRVGSDRYVTLMNQVLPSDDFAGQLVRLDLKPQTKQYRYVIIADSLQRPVHSAHADLTGNGRRDIVVSEFGNRTGSLSWFERVGTNQFQKHILRDAPGALRSVIRDFNGNGRPDVMALMGQGQEGIYLFHNQGEGTFREERLLHFPPTYGSLHFELADFNDDGHVDILHVAGDNLDYGPVMKPYHGLRIFLNDGENNFDESYFYPLNGAYDAAVQDFDGDGDLDIAAVSFFPDYSSPRPESFVYLENQGGLVFKPRTFPERNQGRWITLDHGDLDGDGDEDIVLGPFSVAGSGTSYVPKSISSQWGQGPSLLVLENLRSTD